MNRGFWMISAAITLLSLPGSFGCGTLASLLDEQPASGPTEKPCIAHYSPLTPVSDVGYDDCGNFWVRRDERCWILADSVMIELPMCPAEGDTLGD